MNKLLILLIGLMSITVQAYTAQKVADYFKKYDLNGNKVLQRKQYIKALKIEDEEYGITEEDENYVELTQLLYDQYDKNGDQSLDWEEWVFFAQDIEDEPAKTPPTPTPSEDL